MPQTGIVNILPFFLPKQLKVLQHFFPIVTWRQGLDKDGNHCSVVLSPTCGGGSPVTVAGKPMNLV